MKQYILILLFLCYAAAPAIHAAEGPWLETEQVKIRLISSTLGTGELEFIPAALEIQLKPDWKVYWRSPGDAGLPPLLETENQEQIITRFWPVPERFSLFGIDTFGYSGRVLLPLEIKHTDTGARFFFNGFVDVLICSDICIPISDKISLIIPQAEALPSIHAQEIAITKAKVPSETTGPNIQIQAITLNAKKRKINLEIKVPDDKLDDIFIETSLTGYSFSKPTLIRRLNDRLLAEVDVNGTMSAEALLGEELTLTIISGQEYKEVKRLLLNVGENVKYANAHFTKLIPILLISFIGGFILNFMPCVFPILSLKVASFLSSVSMSHAEVRKHFLATALGILASFCLLSIALIILRNIGYQIGWGMQFQNPIFLGIISLILVLFIVSLFDWFYLPIPDFAVKLSSFVSSKKGYRYDFFSGMLATILATPCSAPFVGTASAFALSGSDLVLFSVLLVMGCGLSLPWLIFVAAPSLSSYLPNPGHWMIRIKQLSALLLAGTLIWILWVFTQLVGWRGEIENIDSGNFKQWSKELMIESIETGYPVFVDVTADWCITCKVNKISVLETKEILEAFKQSEFILLEADWTSPNKEITEFLAIYHKFGIPFDIIFSPQLEEPIILPEILTSKRLLSAIKGASLKLDAYQEKDKESLK